ncbi:hypothetical protein PM082_017319 [Marasmius tenuissimus]|nr:hypothetical protein PM082_017319 [Marasmius tenuissimus]
MLLTLHLFVSLLLFLPGSLAIEAGIVSPVNGTRIKPGASFPFEYQTMGDYGVTSYNFTVWLFTQPPETFHSSNIWAGGYNFGRFAEPNYPGNPNPTNRPPSELVMPDFSKPLGGWGTGAFASNATFYLAVIEEYGDGTPFVGRRIHLSVNEVIYNSTLKSKPFNVQIP